MKVAQIDLEDINYINCVMLFYHIFKKKKKKKKKKKNY